MADTSDFRNGLVINHKNNLVKIVEFLHVKPGKGGAFVRTKLKNIKTGQVIDETFRSGEKIDVIRLEALQFNYLYKDSDDYYFMNNEIVAHNDLKIRVEENFFDSNESNELLNRLIENLPWESMMIKMFGKNLKIPRLQCWIGDEGCDYKLSLIHI